MITSNGRLLQSRNIGFEVYDDSPYSSTYSVDNWERPLEWINVPDPAPGSEVVYMLVAVYEDIPNYLALRVSGTYSVDWGDGDIQTNIAPGELTRKEFDFGSYSNTTSEGFNQALVTVTVDNPGDFTEFITDLRHSYSNLYYTTGVLEMKMSGTNLSNINLSSLTHGPLDKLQNFEFTGTHSDTNLSDLFNGMQNLRNVKMDLQNVQSTHSLFQNCVNLINVDISNLDSSQDMSYMFFGCTSLKELPTINADSCLNMTYMFANCRNIVVGPTINNSNLVTSTNYMFSGCHCLVELPLFDTSSSTTMDHMFSNCWKLYTIPEFNTQNVVDFSEMFEGCWKLAKIPKLDLTSAITTRSMFSNCWSLLNDSKNKGLPYMDTSNISDMRAMFNSCWKLKEIPAFDTSNVTDLSSTFINCMNLKKVPMLNTTNVITMASMFNNCEQLVNVPKFDTSSVNNMSSMFRSCSKLIEVPDFDTSNVTTMANMFDVSTSSDEGGSLIRMPKFDTSNVTNMSDMFSGQVDLQYTTDYDYSIVTDTSSMFENCKNLVRFGNLSSNTIQDANGMFFRCRRLKRVGNINLPAVNNMSSMFLGCEILEKIDSIYTTNALINIVSIFNGCRIIKEIPHFDTSSVTNFNNAFRDCEIIKKLPNFDTSSVTDIRYFVNGCNLLTTIPNSFDFTNVIRMEYSFSNCSSLEELPTMNLPNCIDAYQAFLGCSKIKSVNITNFDSMSEAGYMFSNCTDLQYVNIDSNVTLNMDIQYMFSVCTNLIEVGTFSVIPYTGTSNGLRYSFNGCRRLEKVNIDFQTATTTGYLNAFNGCNNLRELPQIDMTSANPSQLTNIFGSCFSLTRPNFVNLKETLTLFRTNIDYDGYIEIVDNLVTPSTTKELNLYQTPVNVELMDINNRIPLYNKNFDYSQSVSYTYMFDDLYLYTPYDDSNVFTGSGTVSDISGYNYPSPSDNDGYLINSPTYDGTSFEFNGLDQSIIHGANSTTLINNVSIFVVVEPLSIQSGTVSIAGRYGTAGNDNYYLELVDGKPVFGYMDTTFNRREIVWNDPLEVGKKYLIVGRHSDSGNLNDLWVNKETNNYESDNTGSTDNINDPISLLSVGGDAFNGTKYANIKIYKFGVYGRLLDFTTLENQILSLYDKYMKQGLL
jgi:surface protein